MKSYTQMTQAYLVAHGLGQVWIKDRATGLEKLRHVDAKQYKQLRSLGRVVRVGFMPFN